MNIRLSSNRNSAAKRGSALLIVLGMLSFMVISAVAFSMYMRQSRLPSSFLRQKVTSSQLVKAALANAMYRIDLAVRDNPYPGIGEDGNRNFWKNRILVEERNFVENTDNYDSSRVSTMPLEGLAYIPPPLINTVRYWGRQTPTARWSNLGYDAGRYAFTAVNVSDYFDINRLKAGVMRDSSPSNRISMAYLFENDQHTSWSSPSPTAFDTAMAQVRSSGSGEPLVSIADYNLSLKYGALASTGFSSPFCEYIVGKNGDGFVYDDENNAKKQKFITDSWFPGALTNSADTVYLDENDNGYLFDNGRMSLEKLTDRSSNDVLEKHIVPRLNLCELAALADYLDEDSIPVSLAVPTVEHTPMLTGIQVSTFELKPQFEAVESRENLQVSMNGGYGNETWIHKAWRLKSLGGNAKLQVSGAAVYPFKRTSGVSGRPSSFNVEVLVKGFFNRAGDTGLNSMRVTADLFDRGKSKSSDWNGNGSSRIMAQDGGYFTVKGKGRLSLPKDIKEQSDALIDFDIGSIRLEPDFGDNCYVYAVKYKEGEENNAVYDVDNQNLASGKPPFFRTAAGQINKLQGDLGPIGMTFYVWLRILGEGGKTIDLVPAVVDDDSELNGMPDFSMGRSTINKLCGANTPVIPLCTDAIADFSKDSFMKNNGLLEAEEKTLTMYCDDPRYNFAPEDWWKAADEGFGAEKWYELIKDGLTGTDCRQNDIFMFVSDQDYLQSMGELQFLPLVRNGYSDFNKNGETSGSYFNQSLFDGNMRTDRTNLAHHNFMWRSWFQYGDGSHPDNDEFNVYKWGVKDCRAGAAVNPFADTELLMGAFANTPYDWIVASGNYANSIDNDIKLCFNARSSEAKISWEDLQTIAKNIKQKIIANPTGWEEEWFDWNEWSDNSFFGANIDNLDDVDRRYLFSYWRSCLANRQQLFLVFVRAEPTVMGGGSNGHTPAQLGARAVALVWREPVSTIKTEQNSDEDGAYKPHRMRILFYHQFD